MPDNRAVLFFDIDNCLYSERLQIVDSCNDLIHAYIAHHLSVRDEEAKAIRKRYAENGMVVNSMVVNHGIDALDFNEKCNDAIDLESRFAPDQDLRSVLDRFDPGKAKLWLFTNGYVNQGRRIVKALGVEDLFEGITFCDYEQQPVIGKPHLDQYAKAMREAGTAVSSKCYLIDDSRRNCVQAERLGWTAIHFSEPHLGDSGDSICSHRIANLQELHGIFPQFCKDN